SASVAALFDPGWQAEPAIDVLQRNRLELKYIFVTHSHRDHVAALDRIRASFPLAQVYSWPGLRYPAQARGASPVIMLGRLKISTRLTPGHAEDAVTYIIENWPGDPPAVAIVGDALFAGSIGWGFSSWTQARQSVSEQILTLPDDTLICPGHGPVTTVGEEKRSNPFF
ncbi:MAG: MBL fold metallo-hydrolase, partial [Verrucomicrobiae bacterium]|nr:MBL fold metallo-hydrolase [Verrucomicrobiae bacterium]MDW7980118.1 MBL fold metallo-hydrolase [Verrucomicrobiales bacterium]